MSEMKVFNRIKLDNLLREDSIPGDSGAVYCGHPISAHSQISVDDDIDNYLKWDKLHHVQISMEDEEDNE